MSRSARCGSAKIFLLGIGLTAALLGASRSASAQCTPRWDSCFAPGGLEGGSPYAFAVFDDDGAGPHAPALFTAGDFTLAGIAGAGRVAKWDGVSWTRVGTGMDDGISTLCVFDDDGAGTNAPALYAGGYFTTADGAPAGRVAKWDGENWSPVGIGMNSPVYVLAVADDDGPGPNAAALFAGGAFTTADGVGASHVAKWDGVSWSALGSGVNANVWALVSFDADAGGPGPAALYVGGNFGTAGGIPASGIARWNGSAWSQVGGGTTGGVSALAVFDGDASGPIPPALYAGGTFSAAGGLPAQRVARFDGASWAEVGGGADGQVLALSVFDADGAGPLDGMLIVGGEFDSVGGTPGAGRIASWDGSSWSTLSSGLSSTLQPPRVHALAGFDADGGGGGLAELFAGGNFQTAGDVEAVRIARWDGEAWFSLDRGMNGAVRALTVLDEDGAGPGSAAIYAGGSFTVAGGSNAQRVARWDGSAWSPLSTGMSNPTDTSSDVLALASYDADGDGPALPILYAGGEFTYTGMQPTKRIARWNGSSWEALGDGVDNSVFAMASFDEDGGGPNLPVLFVGGVFSMVDGNQNLEVIAKWDGAAWSATTGYVSGGVLALSVFDEDGAGPLAAKLYAGGGFNFWDGMPVSSNLVKYDGTSWSVVPGGTNNLVYCFTVFDEDGSGPNRPALYAGGAFTSIAGVPANRVAKFDGTTWSGVGSGTNNVVRSLTVFDDDGDGPHLAQLVAGGEFTSAGGIPVNRIAKWDGASWLALSTGVVGPLLSEGPHVYALDVFDADGAGPEPAALYAGGPFTVAGPYPSLGIARRNGCGSAIETFCPGDGSVAACPCGNSGGSGRGCQNSASTGGALLSSAGNAGIAGDTLTLTSAGELPSSFSIFLQGNAAIAPVIFGDGLRCVGGALKRLYTKNASGGNAVAPVAGEPTIHQRSAERGDPLSAGAARFYQTYYRDPAVGFCPAPPGSTFNASSGLAIVWGP